MYIVNLHPDELVKIVAHLFVNERRRGRQEYIMYAAEYTFIGSTSEVLKPCKSI